MVSFARHPSKLISLLWTNVLGIQSNSSSGDNERKCVVIISYAVWWKSNSAECDRATRDTEVSQATVVSVWTWAIVHCKIHLERIRNSRPSFLIVFTHSHGGAWMRKHVQADLMCSSYTCFVLQDGWGILFFWSRERQLTCRRNLACRRQFSLKLSQDPACKQPAWRFFGTEEHSTKPHVKNNVWWLFVRSSWKCDLVVVVAYKGLASGPYALPFWPM